MKIYVSFHIIPRINPRLPHQPSTPVSALGPSALELIWDSQVDKGYDMKTDE